MNDAILLRAHLSYDRYIQNEERRENGAPLEYADVHLLSKVKIKKNSLYKNSIGILSDIKGEYISVIIHKNNLTFKVEGLLESDIELISRNSPEEIVENINNDILFDEYLQYVMGNDFTSSLRKLNYVYKYVHKRGLLKKNVSFVDFERKKRIV